jgi:hypothetical protein
MPLAAFHELAERALLYTITSRKIRVLAVMNLKRRPAHWVSRL